MVKPVEDNACVVLYRVLIICFILTFTIATADAFCIGVERVSAFALERAVFLNNGLDSYRGKRQQD